MSLRRRSRRCTPGWCRRWTRDEVPDPAERVAFATAVRAEVDRRKRAGRLFTYDDMLTRLRDSLADPQHGEAAAARLQDRYRIVMVDEFQDTDPIQWEIVRRAFRGRSTVILIGDPKQAIYAFRGADVYSYLDAVRQADEVCTLAVNWRSDQALVDGLDSLLGGAALGDAHIVVRPVVADHHDRRLTSASDLDADRTWLAPVRIRVLPHDPAAESLPSVASLRPQIADDLVADVAALLTSDATVDRGNGPEQVQPADIAVLVRTNARGEALRDRFIANGIPAVMLGASSIFSSAMAQDWLRLLLALDQPRQATVRQAALTCFFGWTFAELAGADRGRPGRPHPADPLVEPHPGRPRGRGTARGGDSRCGGAGAAAGHPGRRAPADRPAAPGSGAACGQAAGQLGVGALVEWLRSRMAEARGNGSDEEVRRLETDAQAVTILTVHRSKGLQFPVVYLPDGWDRHVEQHRRGRDPAAACSPVAAAAWMRARRRRQVRPQADRPLQPVPCRGGRRGPAAGLVALTRARCQVVTWWAASYNTPASALQRFLRPVPGERGRAARGVRG